jgi:hypothetical protein
MFYLNWNQYMNSSNNNNNQTFYSHASWGRLEMKPHEKKIGTKQEQKRRGKIKGDKKSNQKGEKNKTLSQKAKKGTGKKLDKMQ